MVMMMMKWRQVLQLLNDRYIIQLKFNALWFSMDFNSSSRLNDFLFTRSAI
jgi:hypothetical protein